MLVKWTKVERRTVESKRRCRKGYNAAVGPTMCLKRFLSLSLSCSCRQFHQHYTRAFFVRKLRFGSFSSYVLTLAPKFRTKKTRKNVDEIDTCSKYFSLLLPQTKFFWYSLTYSQHYLFLYYLSSTLSLSLTSFLSPFSFFLSISFSLPHNIYFSSLFHPLSLYNSYYCLSL